MPLLLLRFDLCAMCALELACIEMCASTASLLCMPLLLLCFGLCAVCALELLCIEIAATLALAIDFAVSCERAVCRSSERVVAREDKLPGAGTPRLGQETCVSRMLCASSVCCTLGSGEGTIRTECMRAWERGLVGVCGRGGGV